jgi:hypothetical protein
VIGRDGDDRRLVRDVFARIRVAPRPDLARRVRERVAVERRRGRPDGGWQLVLAGGTLALAMVVGLLVDAGALQWPVGGAPTPAPQAATLGSQGPAAPTFLLPHAGGGPGPLRRIDWTGRAIGSVVVPASAAGVAVSPDGALLAVRAAGDPGTDVLDASGRVVARPDAFGAWSSDGAHVACALVAGAAGLQVVTLDLRDPARPRRSAVPVEGLGGASDGWTLGGCAAGSGRLVAFHEPTPPVVDEAAVIVVGTGRVISTVSYDDGLPPVAPVLSTDARLLAENDPELRAASIRDLASGEVVGHVTGLVTGFSGDARLVLTDGELGSPTPGSRAALVDWGWNRTVWAGAGHAVPLASRPGGEELALALTTDPAAPPRALLVDGSGRALDLDASPPHGGSQSA